MRCWWRRRSGCFAPVVVLVALVAAGCSASSASSGAPNGGVLRIGVANNPIDSLNPYVAQGDNAYVTFEYIYPQLVQYNARLQVVGDFAMSWTVSRNGLVWTFHTRPNARWSDGQPLTARDAAWTINLDIKDQNGVTASAAGTVAHLTGATAPNANTLVLRYSQPVDNVLSQLQQIDILPEHVWTRLATGNGAALKTYPNNPPIVSGGPFVLTKYVPNEIALFGRNPYWYGPKPHIAGFGLEFFSNDDAMLTALKSGELDAVESVAPTAVTDVRNSGFVINTISSLGFKDFIINTNPQKTVHRELLNPLVRLALAHAIDRNRIIQVAWNGYAQAGASIIAPADGLWHDSSIKPETFDLALANQELNQAGYRMGPGGVRIADGHPMSYQVIFSTDETGTGDRTFQIIQADFAKIGVQISQRVLDDAATTAAITNPNNKYRTFDMAMWDWAVNPDPDFQLSVLTCAQYGGWSDSGYCNPAYDKLYAEQSTLLNVRQRQAVVWRMQQLVYTDRPYIVLVYPDIIQAYSKHWTGWVTMPAVPGFVSSLTKLSLLSVHRVG